MTSSGVGFDQIRGDPIASAGGRRGSARVAITGPAPARIDTEVPPSDGENDALDPRINEALKQHWRGVLRFAGLLSNNAPRPERLATKAFVRWHTSTRRKHIDDQFDQSETAMTLRKFVIDEFTAQPTTVDRSYSTFEQALEVLSELPVRERAVAILMFDESRNVSEIAHTLGTSQHEAEVMIASLREHVAPDTIDDIQSALMLRATPPSPTAADREEIGRLLARFHRKSHHRSRARAAAIVCALAIVAAGVIAVSRPKPSSAYPPLANGPMRLLPTWLPPGVVSMIPQARDERRPSRNFSNWHLGLWTDGDKRRVSVQLFPDGMDGPTNPEPLPKEEAIAQGQQPGWGAPGTNDASLFWRTEKGGMMAINASEGITFADIADIARAIQLAKSGTSFSLPEPPLDLKQAFLGSAKELDPVEEIQYLPKGTNRGSLYLTASKLPESAFAVYDAFQEPEATDIAVRGTIGKSFSYKDVASQPQIPENRVVIVRDGNWQLVASGQATTAELVQVLNGLREVSEADWEDAQLLRYTASTETLETVRKPTRLVAAGTNHLHGWKIYAAQFARRQKDKPNCIAVRFVTDDESTDEDLCIPVGDTPVVDTPRIRLGNGHVLRLLVTSADISTVRTPSGLLETDRIVFRSGKETEGLGLTVVEIPDNTSSVRVEMFRTLSGKLVPVSERLLNR